MVGRPMSTPRTEFESRVRELMDKAGIKTYVELAEKSGITTVYLHHILSGRRNLGLASVKKLADALGCEIEKLL